AAPSQTVSTTAKPDPGTARGGRGASRSRIGVPPGLARVAPDVTSNSLPGRRARYLRADAGKRAVARSDHLHTVRRLTQGPTRPGRQPGNHSGAARTERTGQRPTADLGQFCLHHQPSRLSLDSGAVPWPSPVFIP